jgi:hypothetical protein
VLVQLPWQQLEPERDHSIVTKGYGQDTVTVLTARTADKKLALSYVPSTGSEPRELTVDLAQFAGPIAAAWYNPTSGRTVAISDMPLPNRDSRPFHTPGDNGTKTNDWLLILRVR